MHRVLLSLPVVLASWTHAYAQSCLPADCLLNGNPATPLLMDLEWRWRGPACDSDNSNSTDCPSTVRLGELTFSCTESGAACAALDDDCGAGGGECQPDPLWFDLVAVAGNTNSRINTLELLLEWDAQHVVLSDYMVHTLTAQYFSPCEAVGTCTNLGGSDCTDNWVPCVVGATDVDDGCNASPSNCLQCAPTDCFGQWMPAQSGFPPGFSPELDFNNGVAAVQPFGLPDNDGDALWTLFAPFGTGSVPAVPLDEMRIATLEFTLVTTGGELPPSTAMHIAPVRQLEGGLEFCSTILGDEGGGPCSHTGQLGSASLLLDSCGGSASDCEDEDNDGIRDLWCNFYTCAPEMLCETTSRVWGDAGGAFGACPADQFANIHDRTHALNCFSATNSCDSFNHDIGGNFGSCLLDGFCNIHDSNHALNAFAGVNSCSDEPCGAPMPEGPGGAPIVVGETQLVASPAMDRVHPGAIVEVDVFIVQALANLQGYQLHSTVSGGGRGALELVDIRVDVRRDAALPTIDFDAINLDNSQMLAGQDFRSTPVSDDAYLATFVYEATADARGDFVISILHDGSAGDQTFLLASTTEKIDIIHATPAVVGVHPSKRRHR